MKSFKGLLIIAVAVIILIGLDQIAQKIYLYDYYYWSDAFMHLFGGAIAGGFILWLLNSLGKVDGGFNKFIFSTVFALFIGVLWELYEFKIGLTHFSVGFWADTVKDLLSDLIGGMFAYVLIYKRNI